MASIGTISAATDRIACQAGSSAQHVFVVKNTSGRPLSIGAQIVPEAGGDGAWFSLEGESERQLAPEESDQFVVNVNPPESAQPATCTFHLLVYDTVAPGEDFSNGPTVQVEVEKPEKPPEPPPKKFPWWIIIVILAVLGLVAAILVFWLTSTPSVEVPNLSDKKLEQARELLESASLKPGEALDASTGEPATSGMVVDQSPKAGTEVDEGTAVDLVVEASPTGAGAVKADLLILYGERAKGDAFAGLLAREGFAVNTLDCNNLDNLPKASYRMLIIGPETTRCWRGYGKPQRGEFYNALSADVRERLASSRLLALGEGGYYLLGGLQSRIGDPKGWHGSKTGVYLTSKALAEGAGLPTRKPINLYTESRHVGIYDQSPAFKEDGVVALGREPDDDSHWTIAQQRLWTFWGYTAGPDRMTQAGRRLFVAVSRYALNSVVSIKHRQAIELLKKHMPRSVQPARTQ